VYVCVYVEYVRMNGQHFTMIVMSHGAVLVGGVCVCV